jgi:hypothetical protein
MTQLTPHNAQAMYSPLKPDLGKVAPLPPLAAGITATTPAPDLAVPPLPPAAPLAEATLPLTCLFAFPTPSLLSSDFSSAFFTEPEVTDDCGSASSLKLEMALFATCNTPREGSDSV